MLSKAIEGFIESLPDERALDLPFISALRSNGFTDVHLVHGSYEFGKDFIAKGIDKKKICQFVFQTKHGDIDLDCWRTLQAQCEEMRYCSIAHPDFDPDLPRVVVVACTGDFDGGSAKTLAQQYAQDLAKRGHRRPQFWTKEKLLKIFTAEDCLGSIDWQVLGQFLAQSISGEVKIFDIESFTQRWLKLGVKISVFAAEAAFLRQELRRNGLSIHAFWLLLAMLRAIYVHECNGWLDSKSASEWESLILKELWRDSDRILQWFSSVPKELRNNAIVDLSPDEMITFGPRTLMMLEIVCLAELSGRAHPQAKDFLEYCLHQEACSRPISDNYAISILIVCIICRQLEIDVKPFIRRLGAWLYDTYAKSHVGLATAHADPTSEMSHILGAAEVGTKRRAESLIASAVLDACSLLAEKELYNEVRLLTRRAQINCLQGLPDVPSKDAIRGASGTLTAFDAFVQTWNGDGWKTSDLHAPADAPRSFDNRGNSWVGAALGLLLRDRWWIHSLAKLATTPMPSNQPTAVTHRHSSSKGTKLKTSKK